MVRRAYPRTSVVLGALLWALPASAALPFDLELGVFGSGMLPGKQHELYNPWVVHQAPMGFAPGFGLRAGAVVPELYVGGEVELGLGFASVTDRPGSAMLMGWRTHVVMGRMPSDLIEAPFSPFVVAGIGNLAVSSADDVLGNDVDAAFHWGAGGQYEFGDIALRADFRHYISSKLGVVKTPGHTFELQLGVTYVIGRDKDTAPDPIPVIADADEDGVPDATDACPDVAGAAPDGCPADTDGDGIVDPDDSCPEEPETVNQIDDEDGCADVIPDDLAMLVDGVPILGFQDGTDQFVAGTTFALDMAAEVLNKHPGLKVRVIVYTRELADPIENFKLSTDRAYAVQAHFISLGIDGNRVEPEGSPVFEAGAYDDASVKTRVTVQVIE